MGIGTFMDYSKEEKFYRDLPRKTRLRFLLLFSLRLTGAARSTYEGQQDGLTDPAFMRLVNELQHQLVQHALALQREHSDIDDDLLVADFFKDIPDREHARVGRAFDDAIQRLRSVD